jgi:prepilin-type N-terminal cleavage/methylation domain-containing protein
MESCAQKNIKGFTLIEMVVVLGITALLMGAITEIFLISFRSRNIVFDQLTAQGDGRRAVDGFINTVRRATYSGIGAYPIEYADSQQLIFFTNNDTDSERERVRYFLSGTTLKKGVIEPVGSPITYPAGTEVVTDVARQVGNGANPVFYYYDQNYDGTTNNYLPLPIDVSKVRIVGIKLIIDKSATSGPVPFTIESKTEIRNLKSN